MKGLNDRRMCKIKKRNKRFDVEFQRVSLLELL